ncbi:lipase [Rhodococcus triatomae]|uniref:Lipase n=1 Tax=Rhodococcus triatomae TaxID=300028 RepID=A0A1G8F513_9NOCA|nr:lipase [Rhodococcus triatomae]
MAVVPILHTYTFGPESGPVVLALHGITGHGRRWSDWATTHLPTARVLAPDLLGHGRSPYTPPWTIEAHVEALVETLDEHAPDARVTVVGHSFGATLALHLARALPDRVHALALLDPALGLDAGTMRTVAEQTVASPDYTDVAEARSEKVHGAWGEVPAHVLDTEIDEHLVTLPNGRVNWRISTPAVITVWGELARPFVLPPDVVPTVLVQAMKVQPPYVTAGFRAALRAHLGDSLTEVELDCDHMVPQARPEEVAALVRGLLP